MAPLYNTERPGGNGCLFFLLIVFTFKFEGRWKTRAHLWIPGFVSGEGLLGRFQGLRPGWRWRFGHGIGTRVKRIKKTVVPVVDAGKVGIVGKQRWEKRLASGEFSKSGRWF
jgi:hypothetical protein